MMQAGRRRALLVALSLGAAVPAPAAAANLPVIGPAPAFALTDQAGRALALADLRGKALAVSFIFTTCSDSCPILTAKMADVKRRLGTDFGPRVNFVSITVDPLNDTPARLRGYASAHGADVPGWHFLTGKPDEIADVVRRYGAFARPSDRGGIEHLFLTTLIDRRGNLRVQYLGWRFDSDEMSRDFRSLLNE